MEKWAFCSPFSVVLSPLSPNVAPLRLTVAVPTLSKTEWKARIEPHLSTSLQTAAEKITQAEPVQAWLRDASTKAAEGLGRQGGMQAEMEGYARMMDDLEEALPELLAAVSELTAGCGSIDLNWRPLQPTQSRLYVDFDQDIDIDLFVRLHTCTTKTARQMLTTVAAALPEGQPYPNRPNTVTGLAAREGASVGVRVKEYLQEDQGRRRSTTLILSKAAPIENLSNAEATRRLLDLLCPDGTER